MIKTRLATYDDLLSIAKIHTCCFPNSYLTQLDKISQRRHDGLICAFYSEFINDAPNLFWVAEDDSLGIIGFCMGYYMDKSDQISNFTKKNKRVLIKKTLRLLLQMNLPTYRKILSRFVKKNPSQTIVNRVYEDIGNDRRGDLLSICVDESFRGKGVSKSLIESFLDSLKKSYRDLCLLSVDGSNIRAVKFYEKNGFILYRVRDDGGLTYMKPL